jgi:ribosomal protein L22
MAKLTFPPTASGLTTPLSQLSLSQTAASQQIRSISFFGWGRKGKKAETTDDIIANEVAQPAAVKRQRVLQQMLPGKVESDSIFSDELASTAPPSTTTSQASNAGEADNQMDRSKEALARAIDPDPLNRVRWQRKMVIRHVAKATDPFSKESRAARIKRTEREVRQKSHFLPTSVKKLVHLARQIAGKPVEEALVQMQYSKKKMAREIALQLEIARDRAIVERGMGLGKVKAAAEEEGRKAVEGDVATAVQKIQTKDGKWMEIDDPTRMYIAQAWVERGPWRGMQMSPRARGRADRILKPSTGISMVLKEEKTRIREHKEREEKKYRQGPWVHLPDRPITAQRQYYSW